MRRHHHIAISLCLVLPDLAAQRAEAGDAVHATTTTLVEYHRSSLDSVDTNGEFIDVINRLNLSFTGALLQADLRLDTFTLLPISPSAYQKEAPPGKEYTYDRRIERLTGLEALANRHGMKKILDAVARMSRRGG